MSTYNLNIDTLNSSLSFYQAEKYNLSRLLGIYGSSRLGMLKDSVNVLGSAFGNTDSSNVIHTLGNKRYELSNHLGNVLTVITDKPIPHNNGGTVDYWQASIASAYDYSPFGVMLTGRTFEGKQTICHDSTTNATQKPLEEGFSSWGSWTTMGNGLVTYVSGEMQVSNPNTSKKDIGASKTFTTGTGVHNVSFKVIGNTCATVVIWPPSSTPIPIQVIVRDNANNIVASGNYTVAGSYNLSFTPVSSGANYKIEFYMANASAFCFFRLDDVLISYDDATTLTVCKEVDGFYRYGFNNKEKDDEVSGTGNNYDYGFRVYSPRLGKFLSVDPLTKDYPWYTPYQFAGNKPTIAIDLDGLEEYIVTVRTFLPYDYVFEPGNKDNIDKSNIRTYAQYHNVEQHGGYKSEQVLVINFNETKSSLSENIPDTHVKNLKSNVLSVYSNKGNGKSGSTSAKFDNNTATARLEMSTSNPAVWYAPSIDYEFDIQITKEGVLSIGGVWDGFPALEIFLENKETKDVFLVLFKNTSDAGKNTAKEGNPDNITNLFDYLGDQKIGFSTGIEYAKKQEDKKKPSEKVAETNRLFSKSKEKK